jgi:hypothetical protein
MIDMKEILDLIDSVDGCEMQHIREQRAKHVGHGKKRKLGEY